MSNLTRYRVDIGDIAGTPVASFSKDINGEFVKFDDIKELLNPAHNSASAERKLLEKFLRKYNAMGISWELAVFADEVEAFLRT